MDWNSSELRAGVDKWPEKEATVTKIDQPFNDGKHDFLSVVTYTFKDESGEYWEGRYQTRTVDLPDDLMEGATITIRYNQRNPDRSWCEDDYYRSRFGRFQSFDYPIALMVMVGVFLMLFGLIEIFHIRAC